MRGRAILNRINVFFLDQEYDNRGRTLVDTISSYFHLSGIKSITTAKSYLLAGDFSNEELTLFSDKLFSDKIIEQYFLNDYPSLDFDFAIEIGFKAGVTDNEARSSRGGIKDILDRDILPEEKLYTSRLFFFKGSISQNEIENIVNNYLFNNLIERGTIISKEKWDNGERFSNKQPTFDFKIEKLFETINLNITDEQLTSISKDRVLSLSLSEMKTIQTHFKNQKNNNIRKENGLNEDPTDVELEVLAQTWSEHCKHKIFSSTINYIDENNNTKTIKSLYKSFVKETTKVVSKKRKDLLSVFEDNAGIVKFDDNYAYCIKVETHNSPSALDPYGGAMTGIVGVNRDIIGTGMGAKPIFNTDVFCFADPFYKKEIPPKLMHPKRIFNGVHHGIIDGGNESGIPTVNGAIVFDDRFLGKPLVFCGTGGIMPLVAAGKETHKKTIRAGDLIVMTGGRIGKDGIHGATFSSEALTEASPTSAVQIGDPITQKKMLDFLMEARDLGLFNGITDNGAGGLSSSIGEMATVSGGCTIQLDKAPLKYKGLYPWEILVSEAQERMSLAVPKDSIDEFLQLAADRDVDATVMGEFNNSGYFKAEYDSKTVCLLEMDFMHNGLPELIFKAQWKLPHFNEPDSKILSQLNHQKTVLSLLSRPNIASKEQWVRQYDHEVQAMSIVKPFEGPKKDGPSDAAVIKPVYSSYKGLVISNGIIPRYSDIDTYHMAQNCIDEAVRNIVAVGGDPENISGLDNFCWPDPVESKSTPDGQYKMAQLVRCNEGLYDICTQYNIPLVSGKDSMKNDYGHGEIKISVPPTLLFTAIATIENIKKSVTSDLKKNGSLLYLLGDTHSELGGSELFAHLGFIGNNIPKVNINTNKKLYKALHEVMKKDHILSCHDLSDGGLATSIAESVIGSTLGAKISLSTISPDRKLSDTDILYSESAGRLLIEIDPSNEKTVLEVFHSLPIYKLGTVINENMLTIKSINGETIINSTSDELKKYWKGFKF